MTKKYTKQELKNIAYSEKHNRNWIPGKRYTAEGKARGDKRAAEMLTGLRSTKV